MKLSEFKEQINSGKQFSVCLFEGEDSYFSDNGFNFLLEKYVKEPSLNLARFDESEVELEALFTSLDSYPFIDEKRITLIKEFYPKTEQLKALEKYFSNANPASILVIINEKKFDGLHKLPGICVVDCARMDSVALARWVKAKCGSLNVEIDLENAKTIAESCLMDMTRINIETEKLCDYVFNKGVIDSDDVALMVSRDSEYKIYEMTDYIAKKEFDKAIHVITEMLSRGETPQRILVSVYNYFRRLLHVAISELTDEELAKVFGIKEYAVKRTRQQSEKFKKRALKEAVDRLTEADYRFKSGLTNVSEEMWFSIFSIMIN